MDIKFFKGLNNVSDPLRLGMSWLSLAKNVNVTDTGGVEKREGFTLVRAGAPLGAYATLDFGRMYVCDAVGITNFNGVTLCSLTSDAPMYWCEVNEQVFFNNGSDSGVISPDNAVVPWRWTAPATPSVSAVTGSLQAGYYQVRCTQILTDGRETGASDIAEITLAQGQALRITGLALGSNVYVCYPDSDVYQLAGTASSTAFTWDGEKDELGRDMLNIFLDPLPQGTDVIQAWKGRLYAAEYMPSENQTVLWFSEPLAFHLFNMNSNFFIVPGRVHMLAPHDDGLLIGTDARVLAYNGTGLVQVADYGVVPGQHWSRDDNRLLFWSVRGLCAALPFTNLTEKAVSVAPGVRAGGCVIRTGGQKRYLSAIQQGGSAFNPLP